MGPSGSHPHPFQGHFFDDHLPSKEIHSIPLAGDSCHLHGIFHRLVGVRYLKPLKGEAQGKEGYIGFVQLHFGPHDLGAHSFDEPRQEDIDPNDFKKALTTSAKTGQPVDIQKFVIANPVKKHDFLLIPGGTIHGSGIGNLVLEISATTYIFTFKMYDWLRMDLNGKPRTLNIERAFENLDFYRKGSRIQEEFISKPRLINKGIDWEIYHLPTHPYQFYDVHRLEFCSAIEQKTEGSCHVMNLVEGESVLLTTANGKQARFNYAETFVVPAAAESYCLESENGSKVKVVKTFIKPKDQWIRGSVPDESV